MFYTGVMWSGVRWTANDPSYCTRDFRFFSLMWSWIVLSRGGSEVRRELRFFYFHLVSWLSVPATISVWCVSQSVSLPLTVILAVPPSPARQSISQSLSSCSSPRIIFANLSCFCQGCYSFIPFLCILFSLFFFLVSSLFVFLFTLFLRLFMVRMLILFLLHYY